MTTTDTELIWIDPGFNHGAARDRALAVLTKIAALIPDQVGIIGLGMNHASAIDVTLLRYDDALSLVSDAVRDGDIKYDPRDVAPSNQIHHHWLFTVDGVPVDVVAVVDAVAIS